MGTKDLFLKLPGLGKTQSNQEHNIKCMKKIINNWHRNVTIDY